MSRVAQKGVSMSSQFRIRWAVLTAATLALLASAPGFAGPRDSGGGDLCEDRIKIVRDDIKAWIQKGGPQGLTLPRDVSISQYSELMLEQINSAKIRCVGPNDAGFPVQVNDTPKVCRFERGSFKSVIVCDFDKFNSLAESDQYILVHHEFAGLANIEIPNGSDSNYEVSNQLSGYLKDELVKKLAIKPGSSFNQIFKNEDGSISIVNPRVTVNGRSYMVGYFSGQGNDSEINSANGFCKLKGYDHWVGMTGATEKDGPIVDLNADGTLFPPSSADNQFGFGSIMCR
jgi:hypothetical protein